MIPLLRKPKTRRTSSGGPDVEAPSQDDETVASRILACELPHLSSALSGQMSEDFRRLGSGSGVQTLPDNQGAAAGDNSAPGTVNSHSSKAHGSIPRGTWSSESRHRASNDPSRTHQSTRDSASARFQTCSSPSSAVISATQRLCSQLEPWFSCLRSYFNNLSLSDPF